MLESIRKADHTRKAWKDTEGTETTYPPDWFCRNFASRHNLSLRASMEMSSARAKVSVEDLVQWQTDTYNTLINKPEFRPIFDDPERIFNQVSMFI